MVFTNLKKSLNDSVLPCYVLEGDDIFILYKALELIESKCVCAFPEMNKIVFGENATYGANDVVESANSLPFGQDKRLVVVRSCNLKPSVENLKEIEKYLANASESSCLVFFNDVKNAFTDKLKNVERVDCNKLPLPMIRKLIAQKCFESGKEINSDAASLLACYCLNSLARINGEIDKLISYVGEQKIITAQDVEINVSKELDFEGYEFAQSVALKNSERAFEILENLMIKNENAGTVISLLYKQFSRMFFVSISKMNNLELASAFAVKEFAIKKTKELALAFGKKQLMKIMENILQTEFEFKSGKISSGALTQNLVFQIINCL